MSRGDSGRRVCGRQRHQRRSLAVLASIAAVACPPVLGAPLLFLYPQLPTATTTTAPSVATASSSSSSSSQQPRRPRRRKRWIDPQSSQVAKDLALRYTPSPAGDYVYACWRLRGRSNCPRSNSTTGDTDPQSSDPPDIPDSDSLVDATTDDVTDPLVNATATSTAPTSVATVEPYEMTFKVQNIPPGWQKTGHSAFYSKRLVIGFSVSLAVLIIFTIVGCVVWRLRVARGRRDLEKQLAKKKEQIIRRLNAEGSDGEEEGEENGDGDAPARNNFTSSVRRRWARRADVPATADDPSSRPSTASSDKPNSPRIRWRPPKRKTRKKLPTPTPTVTSTPLHRANEQIVIADANDPAVRPSPTALSDATLIPTTPMSPMSPITPPTPVPSIRPISPPPPQPQVTTITPTPPSPVHHDDSDDHDLPPAYRRRNFHLSALRPATAPARVITTPAEKPREVEMHVPEEYAGLAPAGRRLVRVGFAADGEETEQQGRLVIDARGHERITNGTVHVDDDDNEEEEQGHDNGGPSREAVSAHVATDEKTVLEGLRTAASAPSAPPLEYGDEMHLHRHVPSLPEWNDEDDDADYEFDDGEGEPDAGPSSSSDPSTSSSARFSMPTLPLPPPPTVQRSALPHYPPLALSSLVSSPPQVLPQYDFPDVPPPPEKASIDEEDEGQEELPSSISLLPSAPEDDETHDGEGMAHRATPSAPPILDDDHGEDSGEGDDDAKKRNRHHL